MKSDREFIEGIYKKAEAIQKAELLQKEKIEETTGKQGGKIVSLRTFRTWAAAAAAVLVICFGAVSVRMYGFDRQEQPPTTASEWQRYRMMTGENGISPASELGPESEVSLVVIGEVAEVTTLEHTKDMAETWSEVCICKTELLSASRADGKANVPECPETITVRYRNIDDHGYEAAFLQGEQVLLFLCYDEQSGEAVYYLQDGFLSKYVFWKEDGTSHYYKNAADTVVDAAIIAAQK